MISFKIDLPHIKLDISRKTLKHVVERWAQTYLNEKIQHNLSSILKRRTGTLARATKFKSAKLTRDGIQVDFYTTVYGPIHEHGGTIKAKKAKYLTIPLRDNKTPAGVARYRATEIPGLFVRRNKHGNLLLSALDGNELKDYFLLKRQVKIPPRKWFSKAATGSVLRLAQLIAFEIERGFRGK